MVWPASAPSPSRRNHRVASGHFDFRTDPQQIRRLAEGPAYADVKEQLRSRLGAARRASGDHRIEAREPWQEYACLRIDGPGARFNRTLTAQRRLAAWDPGKHAVGHPKSQ